MITAFSDTPERPTVALELPAAQQRQTEQIDGVERPVYVPSRSPRLSMLWSRSAPTVWPGGAGARKLRVS